MAAPLVVQKFGGSSLAGADRIKRVARRIARERAAGNDLVIAVSAMGDTTDELMGLASAITEEPDPRELERLLAGYAEHLAQFQRAPERARQVIDGFAVEGVDPAEQAAWTMVANALLNLDEAITRE